MQRILYNGKYAAHVYKHECAVTVNGKFIWATDAFAGSISDSKILRFSGFLQNLLQRETLLADKAYVGFEPLVVTPAKKPPGGQLTEEQKRSNLELSRSRIVIENAFARLKDWKCLKVKFRHDAALHDLVFQVCVRLTNLNMAETPIRATHI
eukprot:Pompholyxophrys_punicea_v1_NODE_797_length_1279_cov_6.843137.p2 type:complete len:152 gc:universal NODE_797_length_1279_cov_6.843137:744-1199(+)